MEKELEDVKKARKVFVEENVSLKLCNDGLKASLNLAKSQIDLLNKTVTDVELYKLKNVHGLINRPISLSEMSNVTDEKQTNDDATGDDLIFVGISSGKRKTMNGKGLPVKR